MITTDDIAKIVTDRFTAVGSLGTDITGGAWYGRGSDPPSAYPYVVFQIEARETQVFSGSLCVQKFEVRAAAYIPIGDAGSDPNGVQQEMNTALVTAAAQTALRNAALRNGTEKILHSRPLSPDGRFEQRLREGRDVFACGVRAELLCQGDRSVS